MRPNKLRQLLDEDRPSVSTHIHTTWPSIVEAIGHTGIYDYVEFVGEYGPYDLHDLDNLCRAAELHDLGMMIKVDQEPRGFLAQRAIGSGFQSRPLRRQPFRRRNPRMRRYRPPRHPPGQRHLRRRHPPFFLYGLRRRQRLRPSPARCGGNGNDRKEGRRRRYRSRAQRRRARHDPVGPLRLQRQYRPRRRGRLSCSQSNRTPHYRTSPKSGRTTPGPKSTTPKTPNTIWTWASNTSASVPISRFSTNGGRKTARACAK